MERPTQGPHTETDRDLTERLSMETSLSEMTCSDTSQQKDTQRPQRHCPTERQRQERPHRHLPKGNTHRPHRHRPTETRPHRQPPKVTHTDLRDTTQQRPPKDDWQTLATETSQRYLSTDTPLRHFPQRPHTKTPHQCHRDFPNIPPTQTSPRDNTQGLHVASEILHSKTSQRDFL